MNAIAASDKFTYLAAAAQPADSLTNMYLTFHAKDLPAGVLETDESRKAIMIFAFKKFYLKHHGVELTAGIVQSECKVVQRQSVKPHKFLPQLSFYHKGLPVVRLFNRNGEYELQVLDPTSSEYDLILAAMFDEVGRSAVPVPDERKRS